MKPILITAALLLACVDDPVRSTGRLDGPEYLGDTVQVTEVGPACADSTDHYKVVARKWRKIAGCYRQWFQDNDIPIDGMPIDSLIYIHLSPDCFGMI